MLHKYEKIDEAMRACVALEFPLVVMVHGALPTNLYHAEEATRDSSAVPTYSFLPPSYNTGTSQAFLSASINGSSSLFTDDAVPFESTLAAPSQDAAVANADLGYLMRPANLPATADRAAVAEAVASGEELTLVKDFPLGNLQGGAAQREALLITLLESRLGSVTLLHLIEEGTPAYESFSAAVPVPATSGGGTAVLPRVHIFYPPTVGLSPMVLHSAALIPQSLHNCVQMGLLRPRNRTEGSSGSGAPAVPISASAAASSLRTFFTSSVTAMNAEHERSRQHPAGGPAAVAAPPVMSTPAVRATGVSHVDALAAAHLISLTGLPTCFSTGPIPGSNAATTNSSHKTILTTPAMTMQTVWRAVEKHLDWAQHEVQQAQAASMWNGVMPPKPGAKFTLTVAQSSNNNSTSETTATKPAVVVTTPAEAAQVRLQDLPRNTVVQVKFEGWPQSENAAASAAEEQSKQPAQQEQQQQQQSTPAPSSSSDYVCEGDVCRRRQPGEVLDKASEKASAQASTTPDSPPASAASPSPSSSSPHSPTPSSGAATATTVPTSIKLHCSLPNGKTLDVDQLNPATDTLQANVRPAVEEALGYSSFLFVCAYPPKRYSAEGDEPRLLKDIGLLRSSALRVVSLDGPGSPDAASAPGQKQQQQQQQQGGAARQILSSAASSLLGMFGGRRTNATSSGTAPPPPGNAHSSVPASAPAGGLRRTYNSMAAMLAANEEAERETAMERLRQEQQAQQQKQDLADGEQRWQAKKSNRYFGGGSTEYIAEDNNDNSERNTKGGRGDQRATNASHSSDLRTAMAGMTPGQQGAFLREQLQRLMQQQRARTGDADGCELGEGEEEGEGNDQQSGIGRQLRAFQGQGRRLAGDEPPSTSTSAAAAGAQPNPAAPPAPSSPPGASPAKKNQ
jgi:hypothetical protein